MNEDGSPWQFCVAALLASALCLAAGGTAVAQISASDKATAEALFDRGLALMREGKFADACQKLEQSQAIDRGIGTMLYLGECYERLGRTASAWALFREASSVARAQGESDRAQTGAARAEALEPKLSRVTVQVAPENAIDGFELLRDGVALPNGLWGMPVPVDPGDHKFEARAPGREPWSSVATVGADAAAVTVSVPPLAAAPAQPNLPPPSALPTTEPVAPQALGTDHTDRGNAGLTDQQTVGIVIGGVGVASLALGTYFGVRAIAKNDDAKKVCAGDMCNTQAGVNDTKSAQSAARLSNVFVFGGAVLAAAGVVVYLMSPEHKEQVAVSLHSDGRMAQVAVRGAF